MHFELRGPVAVKGNELISDLRNEPDLAFRPVDVNNCPEATAVEPTISLTFQSTKVEYCLGLWCAANICCDNRICQKLEFMAFVCAIQLGFPEALLRLKQRTLFGSTYLILQAQKESRHHNLTHFYPFAFFLAVCVL